MERRFALVFAVVLLGVQFFFAGSGQNNAGQRKVTIGLIAKLSGNPVFEAAYTGARVAAKELGERYGVEVVIDWQSPAVANAREQVRTMEYFTRLGASGIAIACSDADLLTPAIDRAVTKGIPVLCYDSDAPKSKRFAYYGPDDVEFGRSIMRELAREMNEEGVIAVLAGEARTLNLQLRLQGIREDLKNYPKMTILPNGVFHHQEIPRPAIEIVNRIQKANPNIKGWAFIGSWPLQIKNSLPWSPGQVKAVAGNAVPAELEHIESGHVQALIGMNCFDMGYKSVELLLAKILRNEEPAQPRIFIPLTRVSRENLDQWSTNWKKWLVKEAFYR